MQLTYARPEFDWPGLLGNRRAAAKYQNLPWLGNYRVIM